MPGKPTYPTRRTVLAGFAGVAASAGLPAYGQTGPAMARGFNMPGAANADRPNFDPFPRRLVHGLRKAGFDHIRLPVKPLLYTRAGGAMRELHHLTRIIEELLDLGFDVVIDMHPGGRLRRALSEDAPEAKQAATKAWRILAPVIAGYPPARIAAELMNEPPFRRRAWQSYSRDLTGLLREHMPDHTLIWGAAKWQNHIETLQQRPPSKDLVVAVHYYKPMVFTHQCQSWGAGHGRAKLSGVRFPINRGWSDAAKLRLALAGSGKTGLSSAVERELSKPTTAITVDADFAALARWSKTTGHRVVINEFGVLRHCAPRADRLAWLEAVRRACEQNGFGWTHWELTRGFGLDLTRNGVPVPDTELVKRLIPHGGIAHGILQ